MSAIENALAANFRDLSEEERCKYNSIKEQIKLIVDKILDYRNSQRSQSTVDEDMIAFQNNFEPRTFIEAAITRFQNIIDGLRNNKILHDFDIRLRPQPIQGRHKISWI